jgi:uncharacterized membrane protein
MNGFSLALLIGIVAGMRAMMAPAAVSWAARLGYLGLSGWLAFLNGPWVPWVLTLLAAGELVTDQLPSTPSRTVPIQFGTRLVVGAVCGAAVTGGLPGALAGSRRLAVIGTARRGRLAGRLAATFGDDRPRGDREDAIALARALVVMSVGENAGGSHAPGHDGDARVGRVATSARSCVALANAAAAAGLRSLGSTRRRLPPAGAVGPARGK